jgi:phosphopantetheinyl transferase
VKDVTLLHASLSADDAWPWQRALLDALPYAKRLELERREPAELRAALAGLALLIAGAERTRGIQLVPGKLLFAPGSKPRSGAGLFFSISHTRAHVACAISETVDPGIDIESAAGVATETERDALRRWTATEAALKAAGLGLRNSAGVRLHARLEYAEIASTRYALLEPQVADGYVCHVAAAGSPPALDVLAVGLDTPEVSAALERSLGFTAQA